MSPTAARLATRTVEVDDPGDLLARVPDPGGMAWVRRGEGMVGWGRARLVRLGTGPERFARAAEALAAQPAEVDDEVGVPGTGLIGFLSATFDPDEDGSVLVIPEMVLGRRGGRAWLTVNGDGLVPQVAAVQALATGARIRYAGTSMPELAWLEAVADAVRAIRGGGLTKVVLARDLAVWSTAPFDARLLARRLAERFADCWTFAVNGLVGATPELLLRRRGDEVTSLVLAGSAGRDADRGRDAALGAALLDSAKDRDEHAQSVASVVDVLAPRTHDLRVDAQPWLLRLANIQHLATAVQGRLTSPAGVLDLVGALHPTAAVCGTPRGEALARIRALERFSRGRYGGPVGWVDAGGDGELGIALRCAELDGTRARLFAGAGIVAESLPEAELEETRIKFRAMQSAFGG